MSLIMTRYTKGFHEYPADHLHIDGYLDWREFVYGGGGGF